MRFRLLATLAVALGLTGCERVPFEPTDASLSTPATDYELSDHPEYVEVVLPYRFVNETGRTLYVPRCNGELTVPRVERLQGDEWVLGWEILYACGGQGPAAIRPGAVIEGTLQVEGWKAERVYPKFEVPEGGAMFRLVLPVYTRNYGLDSPRPEDRLPLESRSTDPFTIRPASGSARGGA
jgi:hypothetical protein